MTSVNAIICCLGSSFRVREPGPSSQVRQFLSGGPGKVTRLTCDTRTRATPPVERCKHYRGRGTVQRAKIPASPCQVSLEFFPARWEWICCSGGFAPGCLLAPCLTTHERGCQPDNGVSTEETEKETRGQCRGPGGLSMMLHVTRGKMPVFV